MPPEAPTAAPPPPVLARRRAPSLGFVFVTLFLDVLGFGLLIPVAPSLVAYVQGLPLDGAEHQAAHSVGLLMAIYAGMQFIFSPFMGSLSDRFGRRPVLLIALLGSAIDYLIAARATALWVLYITRAINGLSGATVPVCSAYIADVTPPEKRAAGYGVIGAAFGLGFIFGPLVGGVLGDSAHELPVVWLYRLPWIGDWIETQLAWHPVGHVTYPYYAAAALTFANFCYGYLIVPESLPVEHRRAFSWSKSNPFGALAWLTRHRVVLTLAAALFLLNVAQFGLHSTWVLSMKSRFHWSPEEVGASLFVVGVTAAVVQGGLARRIIPKFGERACLLFGVALGVLAFCAYGWAPQGWMVYVFIAVASIGGVAGPAAQAITSKAVGPTEQGLLQGALGGLANLSTITGALLATAVFEYFTTEGRAEHFPGAAAPFFSGAALMVLAVVPILLIWNRLPSTVAKAPDESPHPH